jgi:tight adherence protein B
MNTESALILSLICAAAAAPLAILGGRALLLRFHAHEVRWWTTLWDRLSPSPRPAAQHALQFYGGALTAAFVLFLLAPRWWLVAIVAVAWPIRNWIAGVIWQRRKRQIELQLPEAIRTVAAAVDAGCTLPQAIARAADASVEPVRTELRVMSNRYNLGADLRKTIEAARERLDLADFDLFASAVLVGRDMGGDIGLVLSRIARAIQSVHVMRSKVRAATSAGRTNLKGLYVVPFIFVGMAYFVDPEAVRMLFTTPLGWCVAIVAGTIIVFAVSWARRIINVDV